MMGEIKLVLLWGLSVSSWLFRQIEASILSTIIGAGMTLTGMGFLIWQIVSKDNSRRELLEDVHTYYTQLINNLTNEIVRLQQKLEEYETYKSQQGE